MATEKAYKLLAQQRDISNKKAKELMDKGLVYVGDKKVKIARADISDDTKFRVETPADVRVIFEDDYILAINKPAFLDSYDIADTIFSAKLLHRLDRETSGVLLFGKDEAWSEKAIEAFRQRKVIKEYIAWVEGVVYEETEIEAPIATHKHNGKAFSKVDELKGRPAKTTIKPIEIQGKKSKIDIVISTGRTHQIRVHLAHIGKPVVGDSFYGSRTEAKRILLHASRVEILGYDIKAPEPNDILRYK